MVRQAPAIEAFGGGGFRVQGQRFEGSVLILEDEVRAWAPRTLAELTPEHFEAVLAAGIGTIMLDNFSLDDLRRGVEIVGGRATVDASGGVTLETVRAIAETGVDVI